ncbi:hypothetical protein BOX15_Mlig017893g2, partial [Macrostomum lignano]
ADGIDDSLYSRQRYVMGDAAMQRMAAARVLVCGLDGLGVELAKNLALTGVRLLAVQDSRLCTAEDLGDQFFVTADDVANGAARDSASCPRLAELNPYVRIERHSGNVELPDESLGYIAEFDCVALVGASVDAQRRVSAACRTKRIPLVCAAVHGLFGCLFNDFGDVFQVNEPAAEEPREEFVASIDAAAGCVRTLDGRPHRLCVGDFVAFREIRGANRLNSGQWRVTATPKHDAFCIEAEQADLAGYECGGSFVLRVQPVQLQFRPLEHFLDGGPAAEGLSEALVMPDLGKDRAPLRLHCLHLALLRLGFNASAEALASEALACLRQADTPTPEDAEFVRRLARAAAAGGRLQPMCALFGGLAAQEVLKALTAKFTPFRQWLYLDAVELFGDDAASTLPTLTAGAEPRYHRLAACMGAGPVEQARRLRLFLVGCGAIGCELLKNFALCGFCTADGGRLTATDDDVIEKSNLNRQFLFRPGHIRQSKSLVAADVARRMNPSLSVEGLQLRVGRDTERTAFTDAFICRQDACVNALDNVAARRYMDQRCLANQRPLFESGTMGARGHVQVILPFISESYGAQQDPTEEEQVPYCTLKTFPQRIEHCIEWARDKFESSFACKPALVARLLDANGNSPRNIAKRLAADEHVPDAADAFRYLRQRPTSWPDCVQLAGKKFAKYFIHRALHILRAFPPDTRLPDGTPFWSPPKRPPRPVALNANEPLHVSCLLSLARLYAGAFCVPIPAGSDSAEFVAAMLPSITLPEFVPSTKPIETDESKSRADATADSTAGSNADPEAVLALFSSLAEPLTCQPVQFDKDNDSHVDAVASLANLRAAMYGLDTVDRLQVKRIAGRIVPAIATTTAAVAGLVTIEMLKYIRHRPKPSAQPVRDANEQLSGYRNCFLNLAVPLLVLSEPGPCRKQPLPGGRNFTEWDRWEVGPLSRSATIAQLTQQVQQRYGLTPSMVCQGSKSVYIPMLPGHRKRLQQTLLTHARVNPGDSYVDLTVMYEPDASIFRGDAATDDDIETDIVGPIVRVHLSDE